MAATTGAISRRKKKAATKPDAPMASSSPPTSKRRRRLSSLQVVLLTLIGVVLVAGISSITWRTLFPREGNDAPSIYTARVVNEYPHDPQAFTQGLLFVGNRTLFESTGLYGKSSVRRVDLETGKVELVQKMEASYFGEGLTLLGERLFQVAWLTKTGFIYDRNNLNKIKTFTHQMQDGWGLTADGKVLFGSDGTSTLYQLDPQSLKGFLAPKAYPICCIFGLLPNKTGGSSFSFSCYVLHLRQFGQLSFSLVGVVLNSLFAFKNKNHIIQKQIVTYQGDEVRFLNELEFVNGEVWANIWQSDCIARISPADGAVVGWILLPTLRRDLVAAGHNGIDVLNGIAWDSERKRLFVTGKLWPKLYEIVLLPLRKDFKPGVIHQLCMR